MQVRYFILIAIVMAAIAQPSYSKERQKPNVVIVITDDQGYGDLSFTGNPAIKTPAIDKLRDQGTLLNNFHVDPTCAPTRSALMTGRYSNRVGVWHTVQGRSMLRRREVTMADIFGQNGYTTGMFGKWHLGDCYPYRPEDRGFQHCVYHKAGGVGQAPDYWGNDYFDDTYIVNGTYGKAFNYKQARMRIGDIDETKDIPPGAKEVTFKVSLKKGVTKLAPVFIGPGLTATPYYAYVTHKPKPGWQTPQGMGIPIYDPAHGRVPPQINKKKTKVIE